MTGAIVVRAAARARGDDYGDAAGDWAEALGRSQTYSTRSYATVRGELETARSDVAAADGCREQFRVVS